VPIPAGLFYSVLKDEGVIRKCAAPSSEGAFYFNPRSKIKKEVNYVKKIIYI
jgi:hypothetical protein